MNLFLASYPPQDRWQLSVFSNYFHFRDNNQRLHLCQQRRVFWKHLR